MNLLEKRILTWRIAVIAGIFSAIVSIIMLLNYWQIQRSEPLENELLASLVEQLKKDSGNEQLKEDIRRVDLMIRKAYFTKQWQIRAGAYMLIGGVVILFISLRMYQSYSDRMEEPQSEDRHLGRELLLSQRWILVAVLLVFGAALVAAWLSDDQLSEAYALVDATEDTQAPEIEEIVIRSGDGMPADGQRADTEGASEMEEVAEQVPTEEPGGEEPGGRDRDQPVGIGDETAEADMPAVEEGSTLSFIEQFPSFRGPYGLGIAHQKNLPVDWDGASGKNIKWKSTIPLPGYNSPVIWGDKLFLTGASSAEQHIYCYNRQDGTLLWDHRVDYVNRSSENIPRVTDDTGYAAPTTATDGSRICAIYATGDVACVDMNGNKVWARNLGIPDNHYGHSSSLLIYQNLLIVQFDTNAEGKVMALDLASGEEKWSTIRKSKISWASPILADLGDHMEIILASSPEVAAYDPATGRELWTIDCLMGEVGPSPAYDDGIVFAANEYAALVAIQPADPPRLVWEVNDYLPEVASPVADDGLLFIGTSYGVIACYDASTGEIIWEYECDDGIYASPMIADGKVYFLDMAGKMHIFSLDRTMNLVGEPELGERAVSTPAFAGGNIYLRSNGNLYCIGK